MRYRWAVFGLLLGFLVAVPCQAEVRFTRTLNDKTVTFVMEEWTKLEDGSFKNSLTSERKSATLFWDSANTFAGDYAFGCGQAYGYYKAVEAELADRHRKILQLSREAFGKLLDKPVAENPNVTYRQLFGLSPVVARDDFTPSEVRIGRRAWIIDEGDAALFIPSEVLDLPPGFVPGHVAYEVTRRLNVKH